MAGAQDERPQQPPSPGPLEPLALEPLALEPVALEPVALEFSIELNGFAHHSTISTASGMFLNRSPGHTGVMVERRPINLTDAHVVHLDDHSIAVAKEAGWPVHATRDPDRPHLQAAVAGWLRARGAGDPDPAVVHRLDVWTSGVVLLAHTVEARRELTRLFERREVAKVYEAVCVGGPRADDGALKHHLAKRRERGRDVMRSVRSGGKVAITSYRVIDRTGDLSLVRLEPETGRTHQLRVQTAVDGWPILGDRLYGDPAINAAHEAEHQLLHARSLAYVDPFDGRPRVIVAPAPSRFDLLARRFVPGTIRNRVVEGSGSRGDGADEVQ